MVIVLIKKIYTHAQIIKVSVAVLEVAALLDVDMLCLKLYSNSNRSYQ